MFQITSGEYIQMSGRAGRRGIDERGIVIMIVDEKLEPEVGKTLLKVSYWRFHWKFFRNATESALTMRQE